MTSKPLYDEETFETNVPGLYVVGSIARNQHIVNGRPRAVKVVQQIAEQASGYNSPMMTFPWPTVLAAFLASLVEFVEALTIVLAVGTVRGWRPALAGDSCGGRAAGGAGAGFRAASGASERAGLPTCRRHSAAAVWPALAAKGDFTRGGRDCSA